MITEAPITVRDVLRLLLAADSYPRLGNHDWREADLLTAEALQKARTAKPRADDPPEFAQWLETPLTPNCRKPNARRSISHCMISSTTDRAVRRRKPITMQLHVAEHGDRSRRSGADVSSIKPLTP
jgi:hypothetical protein